MPFRSVAEVADAVQQGRHHTQHFFRTGVPGSFGTSNIFGDASIGSSGPPVYNAYLGTALEATQLIGQRNQGIYTGPTLPTQERYLLSVSLTQAGTGGFFPSVYFLDYLMFYPYIDCDSVDEQILDNPVSLPRYTDGEGVRMAFFSQTPSTGAGNSITVNYTNQDGVAKTTVSQIRVSGSIGVNGSGHPGGVNAMGPFVPLANGDRGVRSVQSVQLAGGIGAFAVLVLVKPLFNLALNELASTVEKNFLREQAALPRIYEGAYLNYIYNLSGNTGALGPIIGQAQFIWT
jgi:hypothetical protein